MLFLFLASKNRGSSTTRHYKNHKTRSSLCHLLFQKYLSIYKLYWVQNNIFSYCGSFPTGPSVLFINRDVLFWFFMPKQPWKNNNTSLENNIILLCKYFTLSCYKLPYLLMVMVQKKTICLTLVMLPIYLLPKMWKTSTLFNEVQIVFNWSKKSQMMFLYS